MAVVATRRNREVLSTPSNIPLQSSSGVSADLFGAASGRSLSNVGNAVIKAGDEIANAMFLLEAEDNERVYKELDNALVAFIRTQAHGDGTDENTGYLHTNGMEAVEGYGSQEEAIQAEIKRLADLAPNENVSAAFNEAANDRRNSALSQFLVHSNSQRDVAMAQASDVRVSNAQNEIILDPSSLDSNLAIIQSEIAERGLMLGESEEVIAFNQMATTSKTISAAIQAVGIESATLARGMFEAREDQLTGEDRANLKLFIDELQRVEVAKMEEAERDAEEAHEDAQTASFEAFTLQIANGSMTNTTELQIALSQGEITATMYRNLESYLDSKTVLPEVGNPAMTLSLEKDIRLGVIHGPEGMQAIWDTAVAEGMSTDEVGELMKILDDSSASGGLLFDTPEMKRTIDFIETSTGGPRSEITGQFTSTVDAIRANTAVLDFMSQIRNGVDAADAANDVISRFRVTAQDISEYGLPSMWDSGYPPFTSMTTESLIATTVEIEAYVLKMDDALGSGAITPTTYNRSMRIISIWGQLLANASNNLQSETEGTK